MNQFPYYIHNDIIQYIWSDHCIGLKFKLSLGTNKAMEYIANRNDMVSRFWDYKSDKLSVFKRHMENPYCPLKHIDFIEFTSPEILHKFLDIDNQTGHKQSPLTDKELVFFKESIFNNLTRIYLKEYEWSPRTAELIQSLKNHPSLKSITISVTYNDNYEGIETIPQLQHLSINLYADSSYINIKHLSIIPSLDINIPWSGGNPREYEEVHVSMGLRTLHDVNNNIRKLVIVNLPQSLYETFLEFQRHNYSLKSLSIKDDVSIQFVNQLLQSLNGNIKSITLSPKDYDSRMYQKQQQQLEQQDIYINHNLQSITFINPDISYMTQFFQKMTTSTDYVNLTRLTIDSYNMNIHLPMIQSFSSYLLQTTTLVSLKLIGFPGDSENGFPYYYNETSILFTALSTNRSITRFYWRPYWFRDEKDEYFVNMFNSMIWYFNQPISIETSQLQRIIFGVRYALSKEFNPKPFQTFEETKRDWIHKEICYCRKY